MEHPRAGGHGVELDPVTDDEIRLVTELIVVATTAPGDLEQAVIDNVLGVTPVKSFFPHQRRSDPAS